MTRSLRRADNAGGMLVNAGVDTVSTLREPLADMICDVVSESSITLAKGAL